MSDTGAPFSLDKMPLDGERLPSAKFNANMVVLNALALRDASDTGIFADQVAFFPLDEPSGTRYDKAGGNRLTDNNTVTQADGLRTPAAQFTAANGESLSIADNAELSMADIDFTISAWVYLDTLPALASFVTKGSLDAGATDEYGLFYNHSITKFRFFVQNGGTVGAVSASGTPAATTWYFIVAYHDAANNLVGISVNGGAFQTTAHSAGVLNGTNAFRLGGDATGVGRYHNGRLQNARVFKRVLSLAEVVFLYNGGNGDPLWV